MYLRNSVEGFCFPAIPQKSSITWMLFNAGTVTVRLCSLNILLSMLTPGKLMRQLLEAAHSSRMTFCHHRMHLVPFGFCASVIGAMERGM